MALEKPLEQITEFDLLALIDDGEREGKTLDYKRGVYGAQDQDRAELLADVSSFANTIGGHIVIGMEEKGGLPVALDGVAGLDPDAEMLRIQQIVRSGTRPKMPALAIHPLLLANDHVCLVIRIPKSWARPHAVVNNKEWLRYHARNSNGKYALDAPEIRAAYLLSESTADKMRGFRLARLASTGSQRAALKV